RARRARGPDGAQAERAVGRAAPAGGDRPRARERPVDPAGGRADRQPRLRHGRGDHAAVRGAARHRPNHRAGHARSRHRDARLPPDPPARRARRARPGDERQIVKRFLALLLGLAACHKAQPAPLYEKVAVQRRDIVVTASASGAIQPILTLSVKSKASGEIIEMPVQTGDEVKKGQLLANIDPRIPRNDLTQAEASLTVAKAQLQNATAQLKRSEDLYQSKSIAETDYEAAKLSYATAQSAVVNAEANLQTAKDAMEDTQVRAPVTGTVLELDAVLGTPRDVMSAAQVLGLDPQQVGQQLAAAPASGAPPTSGADSGGNGGAVGRSSGDRRGDGTKLHAAEAPKHDSAAGGAGAT